MGPYDDFEKELNKSITETDNIQPTTIKPTKKDYNPSRSSDAIRDFLYDNRVGFQDPTYLGYEVSIVTDESPLFNYDSYQTVRQSVDLFMYKYLDFPGMSERHNMIFKFREQIKEIFQATTDTDEINLKRRHYVEMISGLDKLNTKIVKYEKEPIEITLSEDVALRTTYLIELYNNIVYDYKNKRQMIPENVLRFNMIIRINDIRDFKLPNDINNNGTIINNKKINNGITYKLNDCNFIFEHSQSHESSIAIGGFDKFNQGVMNSAKLSIKYKSIEKVVETFLMETPDIINNQNLSTTIDDSNNAMYYQTHKSEISNKGVDENGGFLNKLGGSAKKMVVDKFNNGAKKQLINKVNELRGGLINDVFDELHTLTSLPDKLGNVYSTNFRQLSIQNFATSLGNDIFDRAKGKVMDITTNATNKFFDKVSDKAGDMLDGDGSKKLKDYNNDDSKLGKINDILK